jgi:hypothetical protein
LKPQTGAGDGWDDRDLEPPAFKGSVPGKFKSWQIFEDASGATATIEVDALEFVVNYLGEIRARGIGSRYDRATPARKRTAQANAERLFGER